MKIDGAAGMMRLKKRKINNTLQISKPYMGGNRKNYGNF